MRPTAVIDSNAGFEFGRGQTTPERGLTKLWKRRGAAGAGGVEVRALVERVLAARGVVDAAASERFLSPSLAHMHDPSLLPGMDAAAERLLKAVKSGEPIVIYGDYDVDGVSATAILYHTLRAIDPGAKVRSYVPHRIDEGYGLSVEAIAELCAGGAKVIVSVDCGITAAKPAEAARAAGVDLIITDHHTPPSRVEDLPRAYALVHPRLPGGAYPFGELCGAGVAYKLAWRLCTMASGSARVGESLRAHLLEMLSLASLGVIADVVPLLDENRVMATFGLRGIRRSSNPGLMALVAASGLGGERIGEQDVGFKLGPRLNACGRMGHAREAVELLTTATGERARELAENLTRLNDKRRRVEKAILEEARSLAEARGMTREDRRAIVLANEGWHAGVVGIVCSRLVERYHRPVLLLSESEGVCHGSGRSVDGVSLHAALEACSEHLTTFGGHDMAAGLKLPRQRLDAFTDAFIEQCNRMLPPALLAGRVEYDCDATLDELTPDAVSRLERLGPFGRDNPPVRLRLTGLRVSGRPELMGESGAHLRLRVGQGRSARQMKLVGWNWGEQVRAVPPGASMDAVITPKISTWSGSAMVEGEVSDLRIVGV